MCPVKIDIHQQIYKWREVIAERHQLPMVKREAMRLAGKVLASPALYRAAVGAAAAGIEHLPQALLYNPFNAIVDGHLAFAMPVRHVHAVNLNEKAVAAFSVERLSPQAFQLSVKPFKIVTLLVTYD